MCDGPIHFDSGVRVACTLYGTVLLIVSEYRGDLVYKNSAMRATVRESLLWECGKDLMREPAFDLAFRIITITTGCVRRAPSARLIAVPDRLLNFWK
jgi:hypothetical protein